MTAAHRLKGVGWFASCVAVVLGFYLVSLQVANERGKLEGVNRKIGDAERDIRALETEFETRSNLTQLEKWNGDTLALVAPRAGQFVADEAALAAIDVTAGPATVDDGQLQRTAALVVPSLVVPSLNGAGLQAAVVPAASAPVAVPAPAALVQVAAVTPIHEPTPKPAVVAAKPVIATTPKQKALLLRAVAVANVRPQAVAMLDDKLLSDSTLGAILSGARAEARRR